MQAALECECVDTHLVQFDPNQPSNRNFVLWFGPDRTILVRHQLYDYHWANLSPREVPRWLYLSSVGSDAPEYYDQIVAWLEQSPRCGFVPTRDVPDRSGRRSHAGPLPAGQRADLQQRGGGRHRRRRPRSGGRAPRLATPPGPEIVVITDGPDGAYASDGSERYFVPAYPDPVPPKERMGAGDAFSSALVAAMVKGLPLQAALSWAPVNAMTVVQEVGSQTGLLSESQLRKYLVEAPEAYAVTAW